MKKISLTTLGFVMALAIGLNYGADSQHTLKHQEVKQSSHGDHF
ncbi:hypothetical protein [Bacillus manliponensis]|nr:hypothetical protein [Bacillus manliponensis]